MVGYTMREFGMDAKLNPVKILLATQTLLDFKSTNPIEMADQGVYKTRKDLECSSRKYSVGLESFIVLCNTDI